MIRHEEVGVISNRLSASACERRLAFLALVGDDRPDFHPVSDFRKIHLTHRVQRVAEPTEGERPRIQQAPAL